MISKIRKKHSNNYTVIDNKLINDPNLSLKSKALFLYLWSKSESWVVRIRDLMIKNNVGQRIIYAALSELQESNYLYRQRIYINGKVAGMDYWLSDSGDIQNLNLQNVDEGFVDEQNATHSKERTIVSKEDSLKSKKGILFDTFWDLYKKKTGKHKCKTAWQNLSIKVMNTILIHIPKYVRATPESQFRKDPLTYLNSKIWEDEDIVTSNVDDLIAEEIKRREKRDD